MPRSPLISITDTGHHNQIPNAPILLTAKQSPGKFFGLHGVMQVVSDGELQKIQVTGELWKGLPCAIFSAEPDTQPWLQ